MARPIDVQFALNCEQPDVLDYLARTGDEEIQQIVVHNPNTDVRTLLYLTDSPYTSVRCQIAFHDNVTDEIVEKLAKDLAPEVLVSLAMVTTTPEDVLESLAHNTNRVVRYALTRNPATPASALEAIADSEKSNMILLNIAKHRNSNQRTLEKLSQVHLHSIRIAVARNLATQIYVLKEMTQDPAKDIVDIAASRIQH